MMIFATLLSCVILAASLYRGWLGEVFVLSALAAGIVFKPSFGLLAFLISLFWPWRPSEGLLLWLTDCISILLILGWVFSCLTSGAPGLKWSGLEVPVLLFLGALAISLENARDFSLGLVPWIHNLLYFLTFFVLFQRIRVSSTETPLKSYCVIGGVFTLTAVDVLFQTGGRSRGFGGLSGFGYTDLVLPVFFFCLSYYFLAPRAAGKYISGAFWIFLGILASESRNAILGLVLGTTFLLLSLFKAVDGVDLVSVRRRTMTLTLILAGILIGILIFIPSYLAVFGQRWGEFLQEQPVGTAGARLMLWGLAIKSFLSHPLTGIGLNQFQNVIDVYPELKNLVFYLWFRGISVHNVFLSILAESGIIGALSFVIFQVVCFKRAWRAFRLAREREEKAFGLGLLTTFFFITSSSYYGWQWFWWTNAYEYMFFLAVLVVFSQRMVKKYDA